MKHVNLESHDDAVKQFVLALPAESGGVVLELDGRPVARMTPVGKSYDPAKLEAAVLARREESRLLNEAWRDADQQVCDRSMADER